ncbi:MAG: septum site-determining protein MinC [Caldilineaceae bacterium]
MRSKIATLMDGVTVREEHRPIYEQPSVNPITAQSTPPLAAPTQGTSTPVASLPAGSPEPQPTGESAMPPANRSTAAGDDRQKAESVLPESDPLQEPVPGAVNIKGRAGGVLIEVGKGNWPELLVVLTDRLERSASFFRNGKVALALGPRPLTEEELRHLYRLLAQHQLTLGLIRTSSPDTFQLALALGLAAHLEAAAGEILTAAQPTLSNSADEHHFIYSGHLRAGQVLRRQEHILVVGDVNPGATVMSDGDILVWGRLRGVAHAGASGDTRAVIVALDLSPIQLRISDLLAIAPEAQQSRGWGPWKRPVVKQPEIAYLVGNEIVVDAWDATKFGGIATLRR